jgi:hypothetical protein
MLKIAPVVAFSIVALTSSLFGQDVPSVRKGATEVAGFVGASYGIDDFRVMGGGNIAYAVTRLIMPYAEFTYFPGIGREISIPVPFTNPNGSVTITSYNKQFSVPLTDFHGGVHFRIPLKEKHVVPYLAAGAGVIHFYESTQTSNIPLPNGSVLTAVPFTSPAENKFAANFGGGFRFYFNEKFGMRLEAKAYTAKDVATFGKVTVGFFYQIK